tara:strand:+ start:521 stop:727 length:207 start_codon:yes stop_codon:yes gene_type:complete
VREWKASLELEMSGSSGEIDGYQYALVEQTGLIAVRRPDGSFRMLPGADDIDSAVRQFIALDLRSSDD